MSPIHPIYLDHNSTTPLDPEVATAIAHCWARGYANPASQHRQGQEARRALETCRNSILARLGGQAKGMQADSLVITSGGTESNNLAVIGLTLAVLEQKQQTSPLPSPLPSPKAADFQVLISAVEHPSVMGAGEHLARLGFQVRKIRVDRAGLVSLSHLELLLQQPTLLVSVMLANNETGVIQDLPRVAELCRSAEVLLHTDAVQAVAKIPVDFRQLDVAALSLTAHKFNGPRGIGGLVLRQGVRLQPMLYGGFQQLARRPGTEDVALLRGMEVALELFYREPERLQRVAHLRDQLQADLLRQIPQAVVIGNAAARVPSTLNISFPGINRQAFLMAADLAGIAISTGSACASGSSEASGVLLAMGLEKEVIESAVRISLGTTNSALEIEQAGRKIAEIVQSLSSQ